MFYPFYYYIANITIKVYSAQRVYMKALMKALTVIFTVCMVFHEKVNQNLVKEVSVCNVIKNTPL